MQTQFTVERFLDDLRTAAHGTSPQKSVREVLQDAVSGDGSGNNALATALGEPDRAKIEPLYHGPDLTVLNVVFAPQMVFPPHNHRLWAAVGIYAGREDNIFWRRLDGGRLEAAGAQSVGCGEVLPLGHDVIHSVSNPVPRPTAAIHIYGGDFFAVERSEWDPQTLLERPYDVEQNMARFEQANARLDPERVSA